MKPSWDDAPKWAKWIAMDDDGDWYWYEECPTLGRDGIWRANFGDIELVEIGSAGNSLESRP